MTKSAVLVCLALAACVAVGQSQVGPSPELSRVSSSDSVGGPFIVTHADVPLYPAVARAARQSGEVHVRVSVKRGMVTGTETQSSAPPILVGASKENVSTWRFSPDVDGAFDVLYIYELAKEEVTVPENPRIEMRLPSLVRITANPTKAMPLDSR